MATANKGPGCFTIAAGVFLGLVLFVVAPTLCFFAGGLALLGIGVAESLEVEPEPQPPETAAAPPPSVQEPKATLAEAEAWWEARIDAMLEEYKELIVADKRVEADELVRATYAEYDAWAELPEDQRLAWYDQHR